MAFQSNGALAEVRDTLLESYAINDAMNQLLLAHLDARAWRAQLPGQKGKGRTIAAIFAHLHNSRLRWLGNFRPASEAPGAARSASVLDEASRCGTQEKCGAVPPHADRRLVR